MKRKGNNDSPVMMDINDKNKNANNDKVDHCPNKNKSKRRGQKSNMMQQQQQQQQQRETALTEKEESSACTESSSGHQEEEVDMATTKKGEQHEKTHHEDYSTFSFLADDPAASDHAHPARYSSSNSACNSNNTKNNRHGMIAILILLVGVVASATFFSIGISSAKAEEEKNFCRSSNDLVKKIQSVMEDYVNAAAMIHNRCRRRQGSGNSFTRRDFRQLYEYLNATGLDFQACQFYPNISHAQRGAAEAEARAFYAQHYPHVRYRGFVGLIHENSTSVEPMPTNRDYYFPVHYTEPVLGNEAAIDLDMAASGSRRAAILTIMQTGRPALSDRIRLVQEKTTTTNKSGYGNNQHAYGMVLMHPGIPLSAMATADADDDNNDNGGDHDHSWPRDLASIVIRIPDLLQRSTEDHAGLSAVYLYDQSHSSTSSSSADGSNNKPVFLGAVRVTPKSSCDSNCKGKGGSSSNVVAIEKVELDAVTGRKIHRQDVLAPNKILTVVTVSEDDTFEPRLIFVILGGFLILAVSVVNAIWVDANMRRIDKFNALKAQVDAEKTRLILETSEQAAKAERELNDFIAHE
jgi:CHASE domain